MRFVCEVCQTRYIIPDERTRGRVLKVRCKKCGNVILLREGEASSQDAPDDAPAPPRSSATSPEPRRGRVAAPLLSDAGDEATQMVDAGALRKLREESVSSTPKGPVAPARASPSGPQLGQPEPEPSDWHVIIAGKQLGPFGMNGLIEKMLSGEMGPRVFVWRDGMADWRRAEEIPEVARWLPAQPSPTPPPQKIPEAPAPKPKAAKSEPKAAKPEPKAAKPEPKSTAPRAGTSSKAQLERSNSERFFSSAEGEAEDEVAAPQESAPGGDPFALVGDAPGMTSPNPGEVTRFFITQAGVAEHRSPWRIAAYLGGGLAILAGVVIGLAQLGVPVPLVTSSDGLGPRIFNVKKDAKLKNELYGDPAAAAAAAAAAAQIKPNGPRPANPGGPAVQGPVAQGPLAKKAEQHVDKLDKSDKAQLAQLYNNNDLSNLKLKPSGAAAAPVIDRTDAPLNAEQVSKTVDRFRAGYATCIERELKRNPNFQGGKIRIVTTIMSSGLVRQAQIESDDVRLARLVTSSALGGCLTEQTRRMVFPSFQGEPFDAEIPLVLGSSM